MWVAFVLGVAFLDATRDLYIKFTASSTDPVVIAWGYSLFASIFFLPPTLYFGIPEIIDTQSFLTALIIHGILNSIAVPLFFKGIKEADLSLAAPLTAITPLLLIATSPLITHIDGGDFRNELPSMAGLVGVVIIAIGIYLQHFSDMKTQGFFSPLRSIIQNKGCRKVLIASAIWSITIPLDKVGLFSLNVPAGSLSGVFFWGCCVLFSISTFIFLRNLLPKIIEGFRSRKEKVKITPESSVQTENSITASSLAIPLGAIALIGFIDFFICILYMQALLLTIAAYAIAVKSITLLFKVIGGKIFYKESNLKERLVSSGVIVFGIFIINMSDLIGPIDTTSITGQIQYFLLQVFNF